MVKSEKKVQEKQTIQGWILQIMNGIMNELWMGWYQRVVTENQWKKPTLWRLGTYQIILVISQTKLGIRFDVFDIYVFDPSGEYKGNCLNR